VTSDLQDLYQEVILDHNRRPRNFRALDDSKRPGTGATGPIAGAPEAMKIRKVEAHNPLCGDRLTVYLRVEDDVIKDATFQGVGCAISKASASLMTDSVKGKTVAEAEALFERFHRAVTSPPDTPLEDLGKLSALTGVRQFPVRVKCATLAWYALRAAAEARDEVVSTE
jgi:nitrogen fixation NifU-like protein